MAALNPDAPEALCAEILAEARRQAKEVLRQAREEAAALIAKTQAEATQLSTERLALARAEAARRMELLRATIPVEVGRLRALRVEALLREICDEARQALRARTEIDYGETLRSLAAEAVRQMAGDAFVVKLAPEDRRVHGSAIVVEVQQCVGRHSLTLALADDPNISDGGLIVQDAEGRQIWDNRLTVRLERLWPELRRQIAMHLGFVTDNSKGGGA